MDAKQLLTKNETSMGSHARLLKFQMHKGVEKNKQDSPDFYLEKNLYLYSVYYSIGVYRILGKTVMHLGNWSTLFYLEMRKS